MDNGQLIIIDVRPIMFYINDINQLDFINQILPTKEVISIILTRYPYIDNYSLVLYELNKRLDRSLQWDDELREIILELYAEIAEYIQKYMTQYVSEIYLYSSDIITWVDVGSILMKINKI